MPVLLSGAGNIPRSDSFITKFRKMLRFDLLKSQTIPNMDGQDEESFAMENAYDLLAMANSCPDLSILDSGDKIPVTSTSDDKLMDLTRNTNPNGTTQPQHEYSSHKIPLSCRRSTSLNSLEADNYGRDTSSVDGNVAGVLQAGTVAKVVGKLEHAFQAEQQRVYNAGEFARSSQRSSYTGPGFFHKSVSSPSMQNISPNLTTVGPKLIQLSQTKSTNPATKRSFFRRKHKGKRASHLKTFPAASERERMNGSDEYYQEPLGKNALSDPFLSLKEADIECWVKFMKPEVVATLTDKEIKRQEHMYEIVLTEKHHCLTLALMHHLFLNDMNNSGYERQARLLFPGLPDLLQVHFDFLRRLKQKQLEFWARDEPLDTLSDVLMEQFSGDRWLQMIRLYGLLCSSLEKSFELFKVMKQKDPKFTALVNGWNKESLLSRKNVTECLLLVGQRITKYPLLIEPLIKTSTCSVEKADLNKALTSSKELNSRVNERVAERERLNEACLKIDPKSVVHDGQRRIRRHDLLALPNRRLIFSGHAVVNRIVSGNNIMCIGTCNILILTDAMVCTQDVGGRVQFVSPPGLVMLNHIIVRENAGHQMSLFLVMDLGAGPTKPEMIELQVRSPGNRQTWMNAFREAQILFEEEVDLFSDVDEEIGESVEGSDYRAVRGLDELQEQDRKILAMLKTRSKLIESLQAEKPHYWTPNSFEGKDSVLNALSEAVNEIQKTLHAGDGGTSTVNRSASCASEHVTLVLGLPRRADTFGGFDSQQRTSVDFSQSANCRILFQLVIQLADLSGEMFQQMVPSMTPSVSQNNSHLQRRMEELREAQQRFETEKAQWNQTFQKQKEEIERERQELSAMKEALQKQESDISHQREQLYRKLEKLESQGIKPYLDTVAVSPISVTTNFDKLSSGITSRRSPSQPIQPPISNNSSGALNTKQQLPLHLASSLARSNTTSNISINEPQKVLTRSTTVSVPKSSPNGLTGENGKNVIQPIPRGSISSSRIGGVPNSNSVQQMLPLRLSEGLAMKASSLPRGVPNKPLQSSLTQPQLVSPNGNQNQGSRRSSSHSLHHSKSSASILMGNDSASTMGYQNNIYLPSSTDRMSNYYRDSQYCNHQHGNDSPGDYGGNNVPILHRRSGSSPVPMSISNSQPHNQIRIPYTKYSQNEDDEDSSKILFL